MEISIVRECHEIKAVCEKYGLFPDIEEWKEKILFIECCEEKLVQNIT